ncbi:alpha/beta hydrolase family protein [Aminobacter sp. AP02]|nr:alpha/beta hydrolase family protein [Aminobacter sp. AP02]
MEGVPFARRSRVPIPGRLTFCGIPLPGHVCSTYFALGRTFQTSFLYGFLCDSRCWWPQLSQLSDHFRVFAWDAPGAGSSSDPPETFTTASYVHCLAGFLDALGIARAHMLSLSWGGVLAQEFYRPYGGRVRSLVLADTYAGWKGSLPERVWKERFNGCLQDAGGHLRHWPPSLSQASSPPLPRNTFGQNSPPSYLTSTPPGSVSWHCRAPRSTPQKCCQPSTWVLYCCGASIIVAVLHTLRSNFMQRYAERSARLSRTLDT